LCVDCDFHSRGFSEEFLIKTFFFQSFNFTMKKIVLASISAQRRNLLKTAGLKFTVCPSRVKENKRITTTCANLVKHNALLKARDVAGKLSAGLVIAADTVVLDGRGDLIGKPRNLKEAQKILRNLCFRPHWVFTGVAIVDAKTKKTLVSFEKTKVFMQRLTDREIANYHFRTTPLDKAGGFDIEGRGGLFIHRIEGCYSNVIGLPMAKLRVMLKKMGVAVL
jgi:septum formation protein